MYLRLHVIVISTNGNLENRRKSCIFCVLILIILNYRLLVIMSVHYYLMVAVLLFSRRMIYVDGNLLHTKIETCNFVPNNSQVETEILNFVGVLRHIDW